MHATLREYCQRLLLVGGAAFVVGQGLMLLASILQASTDGGFDFGELRFVVFQFVATVGNSLAFAGAIGVVLGLAGRLTRSTPAAPVGTSSVGAPATPPPGPPPFQPDRDG